MYMLVLLIKLFLYISIIFLQGCLKDGFKTDSSTSPKEFCKLPAGVSGSPQNIEEVLTLINALPKPVTIPCFISILDRPLKVELTDNTFSAQPAMGSRNPRIFIMKGNLVISIVPTGHGAKVVEFSFIIENQRSIKAEIPFPVESNLMPDAPYTQVLYQTGTLCAGCHADEQRETSYTFANVFSSVALRPRPNQIVDLENFKTERFKCNRSMEPERCDIIEAFLGFGPVEREPFPEDFSFL